MYTECKKVTYLLNVGGGKFTPTDFCSYWPNGSTDVNAVWSIPRRIFPRCRQTGGSDSCHLSPWRRKPEVMWFSSLCNAFRHERATSCARQHSFRRCWPAWNLTTSTQHKTRNARLPGLWNYECYLPDFISRILYDFLMFVISEYVFRVIYLL